MAVDSIASADLVLDALVTECGGFGQCVEALGCD